MKGSNAWSNLTQNLAIGGLMTHCVVFWGPYVIKSFKQARAGTQPDRHWQVCCYFALAYCIFSPSPSSLGHEKVQGGTLVVVCDPPCAFLLRRYVNYDFIDPDPIIMYIGLIVVLKGETTLPWWAYITALCLGGTPTYMLWLGCALSLMYQALSHRSPPSCMRAWVMVSRPTSL